MKLTFYDFMRAGHVKRWHIVETIRPQTLAEHLWRVTVIAMELHRSITGDSKTAEVTQLMAAAMFHDTPEIRIGDTPTPAKQFIREHAGDVFKKMEEVLLPGIPYVGGQCPDHLLPFIKMADAIEAAHWIHECHAGIHGQAVARTNARIMMELVEKLTNETGQDWYEPVNRVLMELGMPYVSKSMRMTPP